MNLSMNSPAINTVKGNKKTLNMFGSNVVGNKQIEDESNKKKKKEEKICKFGTIRKEDQKELFGKMDFGKLAEMNTVLERNESIYSNLSDYLDRMMG